VREYHALALYGEFYRELGYEDQMAIELFPPGSELISIAFARDRRSFTERDRRLLNLLRPHLARAYRHVQRVALLKRNLEPQRSLPTRVTAVRLDAQSRPVQFGAEAQKWMAEFFPGEVAHPGLPEAVVRWLGRVREGAAEPGCLPRLGIERARGGELLRLRLIVDPATTARMLVLELSTKPKAAHATLGGRLTRREIDVLLQVEVGKTNDETAAALGISPLTVRTHLERIFEKLSVPSRTAAVTRFRLSCSGVRPE
jgi:DNA-binding CsgD family transcriptional regulator